MSKKIDSPLHIEWSQDWVRAANIATGQTAEAASIAELGSILSGMRAAVVGVGRKQVFLKTVRLPKAAPEDLRRVLSVQVGQIFPLPIDQLAFDFIQTTDLNADGLLTLVAAMRADDLRRIRADLQQAGMVPARILPIAMASPAAAAHMGSTDALVVEKSLGGLAFDVVEGGILRQSRVVPLDSDADCEAQRTLAAAKAGDLTRITSTDVDLPGVRRGAQTSLVVLHEAPAFGFVLTEDRENAIKQSVSQRTRMATLLLLSSILLLALVWSNHMDAQSQVDKVTADWSRQQARLNTKIKDSTNDAQAATSITGSLHTAFQPAQPVSDIVALVGDSLPSGAWLNSLSVERGKPVNIRGTALTSDQVGQFVQKLGASPRFRDVRLVFANSAIVGKQPVVQFNVNATSVGNLPMPAPARTTGIGSVTSTSTQSQGQ